MSLLIAMLRPAKRPRLSLAACRCQSSLAQDLQRAGPSSEGMPFKAAREEQGASPAPFESSRPWHELAPSTPARPRAPYPRELTAVLPSARPGGAILPRDPTDPLSNPAAATAKEVQFVQYPYYVKRTSASGGLPVYSDRRGTNGTQRLTVIRRIDGDVEALRQDIARQFPQIQSLYNPYNKQIVLKGDYEREIKLWLRDRGF